jgi:enoyl-CoA hydratase/carnithine racemase
MDDEPRYRSLQLAVDGPIARLTLSRPSRLNALSVALMEEIVAAARWLDTRREVRVVILAGEGKAFSSGFDLDDFGAVGDPAQNEDWSERDRVAQLGRDMADALEGTRPITIASLHGHVIGGGVVLAAACDLRVAAHGTTFAIPEVDLAIPLSWGGIPRLVRELGPALTKELVITCRPFSAAEAHARGFLNAIVDPSELEATVDGLAAAVVARPEVPVAITKRYVNAVTRQMSGAAFDFADGASLLMALSDPGAAAVRRAYVEGVKGSGES